MRRFIQTRFGVPGGNCFETAIACIIEDEGLTRRYFGEAHWYDDTIDYLKKRGFHITWWRAGQGDVPAGYSIAGGMTEGGRPHSVVCLDGKLAHDVSPRQTGLAAIDQWFLVYPAALAGGDA